MKIIAVPNKNKDGLSFPTPHGRAIVLDWIKKYEAFEISPVIEESVKCRRYLEGAIIPAYAEWQYGIDPKDVGKDEQRRFLFKQDFNYEIVEDRDGTPKRAPVSSKGLAAVLTQTYTDWATANGAPIPNPELYKKWRDRYSQDVRFPTFFDFLEFLGIECDAMPSAQAIAVLDEKEPTIAYPKREGEPAF